jgi:hypothetical protein
VAVESLTAASASRFTTRCERSDPLRPERRLALAVLRQAMEDGDAAFLHSAAFEFWLAFLPPISAAVARERLVRLLGRGRRLSRRGEALSARDRRISALLEADPARTSRDIARELGTYPDAVRKVRLGLR